MLKSTKITRNLAKLTLVAVLFVGCKQENPSFQTDEKFNKLYHIREIEGCEYIEVDKGGNGYYYTYVLIHKENCKFCLVRNTK